MGVIRSHIDGWFDASLPRVEDSPLSVETKLTLCRQHGSFSIAYSTAVQRRLSHHCLGDGYIAYATKMGETFALGDPVAPRHRLEAYLDSFIAIMGQPLFVQIGPTTAKALAQRGFGVTLMGVDTVLPFPASDFSGKRNHSIRHSQSRLNRAGFDMREVDSTQPQLRTIADISHKWRSKQIVSRREMAFLNRAFHVETGPDMRRFCLFAPDGALCAFIDFDPIYEAGVVTGYTTAFKRKLPEANNHAEIALTKFAADTFRAEALDRMTLGLSPLANMARSGFLESDVLRGSLTKAFRSKWVNRHIFNLEGQAQFKRRFHGQETPLYMAYPKRSPLAFLALLRLIKTL